jgi:hypothetical protein
MVVNAPAAAMADAFVRNFMPTPLKWVQIPAWLPSEGKSFPRGVCR